MYRPKLRWLAFALTMVLWATACGSRLTYSELASAGPAGSAPTASPGDVVGPSSGAAEDGGVGTNAAAPGTPTVSGSGTSGAAPGAATATSPGGSSSATPGASASQSAGTGNAAQCTGPKSTITIGTVGEQSGLIGASVYAGVQAVQAWVAATNAAGGINCHPLKYVVLDDEGDPSQNAALTQQLVEQDHAIAIVYADAVFAGQASIAYLTRKQIPVIGSETGENWFYTSPTYFPQVSSGDSVLESGIAAGAQVAVPQGKTRLGTISCIEASICSDLYSIAPAFAPKVGLNLVYRGQTSITEPDYTSSCQAAEAANVQLFYVGLDASSVERLIRSCASINYKPLFLTVSSSASPSLAQVPAADGSVIGLTVHPYTDTSVPAVAEFQQTLAQYAPGVPPSIPAITGWTAAKLFELAAESSPDPTSQTVLDGLWSIKNNTLGGLTGPLTFTKGQDAPKTLCYWVMQISHGQFTATPGLAARCISP